MRTWYILTSVILCLVLAPMVQANAVFWDLLIQPTITNDPVPVAGNPALSGIITDHGGDAVIGANVSVRTLGHTAWLETDEHGRFAYSFNETTTKDGTDDTKIEGGYPQTRKTQSPIQGKVIRFSKRRTRFFTKIFW